MSPLHLMVLKCVGAIVTEYRWSKKFCAFKPDIEEKYMFSLSIGAINYAQERTKLKSGIFLNGLIANCPSGSCR